MRRYDFVEYGTWSKYSYSGVYMIVCKEDKKLYVGSSSNIGDRLGKHFSELRHNRHTNKELQLAHNNNKQLSIKIVEKCNTDVLLDREVYWQKQFINNLYNEKVTGVYEKESLKASRGSGSKEGHKTSEYRKKMSIIKSQKLHQKDMTGNILYTYDSVLEACEKNPTFKAQTIRGACNGSKSSAYGFLWYWDKDLLI